MENVVLVCHDCVKQLLGYFHRHFHYLTLQQTDLHLNVTCSFHVTLEYIFQQALVYQNHQDLRSTDN